MGIQRQDAWLEEEDVQLANIVIEHIKSGSTQLKAFEEAAKKLKRTPAACGFRWNAFLRKKYNEQIKQAKVKKNIQEKDQVPTDYNYSQITQQLKEMISTFDHVNIENDLLKKENAKLEQQLVKVEKENERLKIMKKEYIDLLTIIQKIRLEPSRTTEH